MVKNTVIDTIEKVFRYFIPGFIFIFLFKLSYPSSEKYILPNISSLEFFIYVPCFGMVIYGIHRLLMSSFVEIYLYLIDLTAVSNFSKSKNIFHKLIEYPGALSQFFQVRHKAENQNLSGYLFYRWSIQHYCLILSELLYFFYFIHAPDSFIETS